MPAVVSRFLNSVGTMTSSSHSSQALLSSQPGRPMEAAVAAALPSVLSPDNAARKAAEAQLQARHLALHSAACAASAPLRTSRASPHVQ